MKNFSKTRLISFFVSLIFISLILFFRNQYLYTTIVDDAYIFFRYTENLVAGFGFVWNAGENPVEGYTSFLYLVFLYFAKLCSFDLELFSISFGVINSAFAFYVIFLLFQNINNNLVKENLFTAFLIMVSPIFLYWTSAGMETAFFSMFLLLTVYFFLFEETPGIKNQSFPLFILFKGFMFGLLCLIRFEAVLFFLLSVWYLMRKNQSLYRLYFNKKVLIFSIGFGIIFGAFFVWRWIYFGFFFPNTYYAKTGGGLAQILNGVDYTFNSLKAIYGSGWILILFVFCFIKPGKIKAAEIYLFSLATVQLISTILLGGDHFYPGRFIIPVLPFLLIFLPQALHNFLNLNQMKKASSNLILSAMFLIMLSILSNKLPYRQAIKGIENFINNRSDTVVNYYPPANGYVPEWQHGWILMGRTMNKIAEPNEQIAAIPIGALAYYSKINVIDMVGIVDPAISHSELSEKIDEWIPGHNKGSGKYILSKQPEYIQLVDYLTKKPQANPDLKSLRFKSRKEIWESLEFHTNYEFFPVKVEGGWYYNLYKNKF
jgi:hypothetical protein